MTRTANHTTILLIAALEQKPTSPSWLKLAIHDALHGKPMSVEREQRMCAALGIYPPASEFVIAACPDCGGMPHVATAGCGGKNVVDVVVLERGETVRKTRGVWQSKAVPEVSAMVDALQSVVKAKHEINRQRNK